MSAEDFNEKPEFPSFEELRQHFNRFLETGIPGFTTKKAEQAASLVYEVHENIVKILKTLKLTKVPSSFAAKSELEFDQGYYHFWESTGLFVPHITCQRQIKIIELHPEALYNSLLPHQINSQTDPKIKRLIGEFTAFEGILAGIHCFLKDKESKNRLGYLKSLFLRNLTSGKINFLRIEFSIASNNLYSMLVQNPATERSSYYDDFSSLDRDSQILECLTTVYNFLEHNREEISKLGPHLTRTR